MLVRSGEGQPLPGLVVEQRPTERGWRVLVVIVGTDSEGSRTVTVRWVDAAEVEPAGMPHVAARLPHVPTGDDRTRPGVDSVFRRGGGPGADRAGI